MNIRKFMCSLFTLLTLGAAVVSYSGIPETHSRQCSMREIEKKFGYHVSKHAKDRIRQRHIPLEEVYDTLSKGTKYMDTKRGNYVFRFKETNILITDKTIITLYHGRVKAKWKKVYN